MLEILEAAYVKLHARGGKTPKLSVLDKLVITLGYYREYRIQQHIAFDYGVVKSAICESIQWVESELLKAELIVDARTERIIYFAQSKGRAHDFKLFKDSCKGILSKIKADSGYQGISDIHLNSEVPRRKSKKHTLAKEEKLSNKILSMENNFD